MGQPQIIELIPNNFLDMRPMTDTFRRITAVASSAFVLLPALPCNASNLPLNAQQRNAEQIEAPHPIQNRDLVDCINADWQQKVQEQARFTTESQECIRILVDKREKAYKASRWSDVAASTRAIIRLLEAAIFGNHQSISGIGIKIAQARDKSFLVEALSANSPAHEAGIKAGDEILSIDNKEIKNRSTQDVVEMIRGRPDTKAKIKWRSGKKEYTKAINRKAFSLDGHRRAKDFVADYGILFESYFNLNMVSDMLALFPEYQRLLVEEYGRDHPYLGEVYEKHALAMITKGDSKAALTSINHAIDINSVAHGSGSGVIARNNIFKADILMELKDDSAALESLETATKIYLRDNEALNSNMIEFVAEKIIRVGYRCNFGATSRSRCSEMNTVGKSFADRFLKVSNIALVDIGLNNGYSSLLLGDSASAIKSYSENIEILRRYHHDDLGRLIPAMSILAGLYANESIRKAEDLNLEILNITELQKGRNSKEHVAAQIELAEWYAREGIDEKAFGILSMVGSNITKKTPANREELYHILGSLGKILKVYTRIGRFSELQHIIDKIEWFSKNQPGDLVARINLHIADGYHSVFANKDYDKALSKWIEVRKILETSKAEVLSLIHPDGAVADYQYNTLRQNLEEDIAGIYALQWNYQSAIDAIDRAIEAKSAYYDTAWMSIINLLTSKARYQISAGNLDAAKASIKDATKIEMEKRKNIQTTDLHLLRGGIAALKKEPTQAADGFVSYTNSLLANLRRQLSESSEDIRRQLVQSTAAGFSAIYYDYQLGELLDRAALHARLNLHGISVDVEKALHTNSGVGADPSSESASIRTVNWLPISVEATSQALPPNGILVEFQKISHYPKPTQFYLKDTALVVSYMALVLTPDGHVQRFNLGPATAIDQSIAAAITATTANNSDSLLLWKSVSTKLFSPITRSLGEGTEIFVSPDSEISRVPFNSLPDPERKDSFLDERYKLRVLSSGKDLLRPERASQAGNGHSVVIANPKFGDITGTARIDTATDRAPEASDWMWSPLVATAKEGQVISALLGAQLLKESSASVDNLLKVQSPLVLHIATHGYFMRSIGDREGGIAGLAPSKFSTELTTLQGPSPLERSGLVLAGANLNLPWDKNSGYLTASQASSLNLGGTEMVVLSACSTGQGDLLTGEGVYGLQRSLLVAGARSTLLSLWKVDDAATAELMTRFYERLKAGEARSEALVNTQREFRDGVIGNGQWKDPYYWAAWQLVGDWRPIKGL